MTAIERAKALRAQGEAQRAVDCGAGARAPYEEAVAILRGEDAPLLLAHTIRHLGDVHQEQGRPELARPCYDEALAIYRARPEAHPLDVANAVRAMAAHKAQAGEAAHALWEEARAAYALLGIEAGVRECTRRLAG